MARAEELFSRIESGGIEAINRIVEDIVAEELFVDCKRSGDDGNNARLHESDQRNFARAISGFANSDGGVLIWGVDRRTDRQGIEQAAKNPLTDAGAFRSRLEAAVSRSTYPVHNGVRHTVVLEPNSASGYVVTLVPKAQSGPIRSIVSPGGYLVRAGDSFVATAHDVLGALFGRMPPAVIWPQLTTARIGRNAGTADYTIPFAIGLHNGGATYIERPYISVQNVADRDASVDFRGGLAPDSVFERRRSSIGNFQFVAHQGVVIAPGATDDVCELSIVVHNRANSGVHLKFTIGALNAAPLLFELAASAEAINDACTRVGQEANYSSQLLKFDEAIEALKAALS